MNTFILALLVTAGGQSVSAGVGYARSDTLDARGAIIVGTYDKHSHCIEQRDQLNDAYRTSYKAYICINKINTKFKRETSK